MNEIHTIQTESAIYCLQKLKEPLMGLTKTKIIEFTGRLFDYKEFRKYSDTFIETGNAAGDGLQRALDAGYKTVWGIEAGKYWWQQCYNRFIGLKNIILLLGKSTEKLSHLPDMVLKSTSIFYLDAHVSGELSFGHEDWIKNGEESEAAQGKTIKAELNIILSNYNKHIICIDDVNGLADGHAEEYMDLILSYNQEYKFQFFDEQLDPKGPRYKDKILTAIL